MSERSAARRLEAQRIEPTRVGLAAGILSTLCALGSTVAILVCLGVVRLQFGAFAVGSPLQIFFLNLLTGACLLAGGIGLLIRRTWGWWLAIAGASIGLLDLARLFRGLFAIINPDHPEATSIASTLTRWVSMPAALYIVVLVVLCRRDLRENFRVTSRELPRGTRSRRASAGEPARGSRGQGT